MKLVFIWPGKKTNFSIRSIFSRMFELNGITSVPVILRTAAAMVKDDYNVEIINENRKNINFEDEAEIVFIAAYSFNVNRAYEISKKFREKNKTTILCGWHPTSMFNESKKFADSVIIGEPALSIVSIIDDFKKGKIKSFYRSTPTNPLILPTPFYSLSEPIVFNARIQATRGCEKHCDFCGIPRIEANRHLKRPVKDVRRDMESINCKSFMFVDNSLTSDSDYVKDLFKEISQLNKKITCYGSINILNKDEEILKLASDAGCETWLVGFESIFQENIDSVKKVTNKTNEYESAIRKIIDHGSNVHGNFIFGFDYDTPAVFGKTFEIIKDWDLISAGFHLLTPYPGTPLFDKLDKEGRILTKNWDEYNLQHVVFKPKNISPEELEKGVFKIYQSFYSNPQVLNRLIRNVKHGNYCISEFSKQIMN